MWKQIPTKKLNILLNLEYKDFAKIEVEKSQKESVVCFTLNLWISYVLETSLDFYKMEDLSRILTYIKKEIEDLDERLDSMSRKELDAWKDLFEHKINEY